MSFFSSKTKIQVFSNTSPLGDPDYDPVKEAILYSILGGYSLVDSLLANALNGLASKVDSMRSYAKSTYALGLPTGNSYNLSIADEVDILDSLKADLGEPDATINYSMQTVMNAGFAVLPYLVDDRGYIPNSVASPPPGLVLRTSINNGQFYAANPISNAISVSSINLSANHLYAEITYRITESYTKPFSDPPYVVSGVYSFTESIPLDSSIQMGKDYYIVNYSTPAKAGQWWYYNMGTGLYPALSLQPVSDIPNHLYPVIPLRHNNASLVTPALENTNLYITSEKLLNKLGISLTEVATALESNPGIADVDHAFIMFGLDLQNTDDNSVAYFVEFFDYLYDISNATAYTYFSSIMNNTYFPSNRFSFSPENNTISLVEDGLDFSITFTYITSETIKGSIGSIGSTSVSRSEYVPPVQAVEIDSNGLPVNHDSEFGNYHFGAVHIDMATITFRQQITSTQYKEVTVVGLMHTNNIYGHAVWTTLTDTINDPNNHNFILPLHYGAMQRLPLDQQNIVYMLSIQLISQSIVETTVKWYESGIFGALMKVVSFIFTIFTAGVYAIVYAGLLMASWLAADLGLFWASVALTVISLGSNLAASYEVFATEAGRFFATASDYLSLTSSLLKVATMPTTFRLRQIQGEFEDLQAEIEVADKELDVARELLDTDSDLSVDAMLLLNRTEQVSLLGPSETPTRFYNRTLNADPGSSVFSVMENWYEAMLVLPEPAYT